MRVHGGGTAAARQRRSLGAHDSLICTGETLRETNDEQSSSRQQSPFPLVAAWPKSAPSAVLHTGHAYACIQQGHASKRTSPVGSTGVEPPNKALKLSRPGFGPAAEPPGPNSTCAASRRLQIGTSGAASGVPLFAQPRGPGRAA